MREYRDVSLRDIAACMHACVWRSNPTFVVRPILRNIAWVGFALRSWWGGACTFGDLIRLFAGGKSDSAVKKKIKERSEEEIIELLGGVPRLAFEGFRLTPHNSSLAGIIDFLTLIQQIIILDQYHARDFLREDSIVIDAGANIGVFTVFAASIAKQGKVYAFEPAPPARSILAEHVRDAANIEVVAAGLGEQTDERDMWVNAEFPGFSALRDTGIDGTGGQSAAVLEKVKIFSLDDFATERHLPKVDFIKMDTEGYEKNILRGAVATIRTHTPAIAASAYHFPGDKEEMPRIVLGAEPKYRYKLSARAEEDYVFWVPKS